MAGFRELRGVNVKFLSSNPEKAHPCAEPRHYFDVLRVKIGSGVRRLGSWLLEEPGQKKKPIE